MSDQKEGKKEPGKTKITLSFINQELQMVL